MEEGFSDAEIRAIREWIATARKREEIQRRRAAACDELRRGVRKVNPPSPRRPRLSRRQGIGGRRRATS